MITHYAPDVPAFIVGNQNEESDTSKLETELVRDAVIIDFNRNLENLHQIAKCYVDLSPGGNVSEAAQKLFDTLRMAEKVSDARIILLPNLGQIKQEHADALFDRIFRAGSGRFATIEGGVIRFSSVIAADAEEETAIDME